MVQSGQCARKEQLLTSRLPNGVKGAVDSSGSSQLDQVEGQDALTDRILAALPQLSKKHNKIARFILDYQDVVVFASASEVGIRTDTSAATVVRFCQALGYEGYLQLQTAIRERVSAQWTAVRHFEERLTGPIADEELVTRVFATDIHNIERTAVPLPASACRLPLPKYTVRDRRSSWVVDWPPYWWNSWAIPCR